MLLQADDGRAQHADAVRLQGANEVERIDAPEFDILAALAFEPHPDPRDAQLDKLVRRIGVEDPGRTEYVKRPALVMLLLQLQQP